jgi:hypothetical protein
MRYRQVLRPIISSLPSRSISLERDMQVSRLRQTQIHYSRSVGRLARLRLLSWIIKSGPNTLLRLVRLILNGFRVGLEDTLYA